MGHFGGAFVSGRQDGWGRKPAFSMGPLSTLSTPGTPQKSEGPFPQAPGLLFPGLKNWKCSLWSEGNWTWELTVENRVLGSGCAGHSPNFLYIGVSGTWSFLPQRSVFGGMWTRKDLQVPKTPGHSAFLACGWAQVNIWYTWFSWDIPPQRSILESLASVPYSIPTNEVGPPSELSPLKCFIFSLS